jgi:putative ABC transport system permease protein
MKFIPLIWKNIWRRKFRTTFTLLSIFIAFVLFGILMTIAFVLLRRRDRRRDRLVLIKVTSSCRFRSYMRLAHAWRETVTHNPGLAGITTRRSSSRGRSRKRSTSTPSSRPPDQSRLHGDR